MVAFTQIQHSFCYLQTQATHLSYKKRYFQLSVLTLLVLGIVLLLNANPALAQESVNTPKLNPQVILRNALQSINSKEIGRASGREIV